MGISGCGKSLCVKTISTLWNLPLFRLDMNAVFGTDNPEMTFLRALRAVEAVSPAVLWIDEIEMGVGGYREGQDASMSRIFSGFLTWMQEKSALVFVAATANRIHLLPAEIIRKGRFDQVFFVDLPERGGAQADLRDPPEEEPSATWRRFDLVFLAKATNGWNGAEIEQAVVSAVVDAYAENRGAQRGRPVPDDLGHRSARGDDGRADQADPQLGARARAERLAGLNALAVKRLFSSCCWPEALFAYRYAVVEAPVRACRRFARPGAGKTRRRRRP